MSLSQQDRNEIKEIITDSVRLALHENRKDMHELVARDLQAHQNECRLLSKEETQKLMQAEIVKNQTEQDLKTTKENVTLGIRIISLFTVLSFCVGAAGAEVHRYVWTVLGARIVGGVK